MDTSNLLVAGDFNFHMDNISNNDTRRFLDLLEVADLKQHVEGPTHVAGHTIDLLITRSSDTFSEQYKDRHSAHVRPFGNSLHTATYETT